MRFLLPLMLLFSSLVQAQDLVADINPSRPIVIDSTMTMIDGTGVLLMGRWFVVNMYIKNEFDTPVVVDQVVFHLKSVEGQIHDKDLAITPVEIPAGETLTLQRQYIDGLTASASLEYDVSLDIMGYKGTTAAPGDKIKTLKFFKTQ